MVNKVKASKFLLAKEKSFKNQTHGLMSVLSSCLLCCKLKWVCDLEIPLMHHNDGQNSKQMKCFKLYNNKSTTTHRQLQIFMNRGLM